VCARTSVRDWSMFYLCMYIDHLLANPLFNQINAAKPIAEVFEDVKTVFQPYGPKVRTYKFARKFLRFTNHM
jgi:hypothetical protein